MTEMDSLPDATTNLAKHSDCRDYICKLIKRYIFWLIQFPCYPYNELVGKGLVKREQVHVQDIIMDELKEYEHCSNKHRSSKHQYLLVLISSVYVIKNLFVPWITVSTLDFVKLDLNSSSQFWISETTVQVVCTKNNCSQFFLPQSQIKLDIRHFPLIPVCYPNLGRFYPPTLFLGPYAVLTHAVAGCAAFIWGIVLPLNQLYYPLKCETLMFLVAPRLTRNIMIFDAKQIYEDYKTSFINYVKFIDVYKMLRLSRLSYCAPMDYWHMANNGFDRPRETNDDDMNPEIITDREPLAIADSKDSRRVSDERSSLPRDNQDDQVALECLPNIRTLWWHARAQDTFVKMVVCIVIVFSLEGLLLGFDLLRRIKIKAGELEYFRHALVGCKAWFVDGREIPVQSWSMEWTLLTMTDNIVLLIFLLAAPGMYALYYLINHELNYWRLEIHNKLEILIEITRLRSRKSSVDLFCSGNDRQNVYRIRSSLVSQKDEGLTSLLYGYYDSYGNLSREKLTGRISTQQLILRRLSQAELSTDKYLDMVAKLYVSFRLFMGHVKHCSDTTPPLLFLTYLVAYGITLVTVWHSKLINQFSSEHMLIVFTCTSWSTILLALMSNFHAKVSTLIR